MRLAPVETFYSGVIPVTGELVRFIDQIPQPHREWWRAWGLDFELTETLAACGSCNMASRGPSGEAIAIRDAETQPEFYDSRLKCCTFFPEIPNFIWARLALQVPPEGLLTPRGLQPTTSYRERFARGGFGQRRDLLCPFFSGGGCSIWNQRPSPCVRFVCQSSFGLAGQKVWEASEALLRLTEETLANDVLLRLGLDPSEIASDKWFEFQPASLLARSAEIVFALTPEDVWDLLQPQGQSLRDQLCQAAADALGSRP